MFFQREFVPSADKRYSVNRCSQPIRPIDLLRLINFLRFGSIYCSGKLITNTLASVPIRGCSSFHGLNGSFGFVADSETWHRLVPRVKSVLPSFRVLLRLVLSGVLFTASSAAGVLSVPVHSSIRPDIFFDVTVEINLIIFHGFLTIGEDL